MGLEIERKYTVNDKIFALIDSLPTAEAIRQGYLNSNAERTVRVRVKANKAYLTVKGKNSGISRLEFEYEIPMDDALELLKLCEPYTIEKVRYTFTLNNLLWELDVFEGMHKGLIIAELELEDADMQVELPEWVDKEVSDDPEYYNNNLSKKPWVNK
jgi:adenylate cyclase